METKAARRGVAMKYEVRRFKSMAVALPELRQIIHSPALLENGRPIENFGGLRPRELVGNWLICAVVNAERGSEDLYFTTDPTTNDCDGLIIDTDLDELFFTEHVFVAERNDGAAEALILDRIAQKNAKGVAYARGRTLVVLTNGGAGVWFPNDLAEEDLQPFHFADVWAISLQNVGAGGAYVYGVARLDLVAGDAWVLGTCTSRLISTTGRSTVFSSPGSFRCTATGSPAAPGLGSSRVKVTCSAPHLPKD